MKKKKKKKEAVRLFKIKLKKKKKKSIDFLEKTEPEFFTRINSVF